MNQKDLGNASSLLGLPLHQRSPTPNRFLLVTTFLLVDLMFQTNSCQRQSVAEECLCDCSLLSLR